MNNFLHINYNMEGIIGNYNKLPRNYFFKGDNYVKNKQVNYY